MVGGKFMHLSSPSLETSPTFVDDMWFKYILSVISATIAEGATYPLDLIKTRLQIQGEIASSKGDAGSYRGMLKTAVGIVKEEGLIRLWQGITPAIYRHAIYTGVRFGAYEKMRENVFKKNPDGSYSLWKAAIGGMSAGALGQFMASPTDLVKVQIQMEGKRRLEGKPPRVKNAFHAFQQIMKQGGIRGLWKGWVPNVQRAALVNLGDLTTYDTAKRYILRNSQLKDTSLVHIMSSMCAGLVGAIMATPADVIKTRVMNQPTDERGRGLYYKSSIDCFLKTAQQEGFLAMYKGFFPAWIRMGPWSLCFWLSYEKIRKAMGTAAF
ncbi:mitochondrial uncoupling protein 4-like [Daphnia pulex]|uniref:mitochondrial uncoupling protein 4-like n=1 Tax=Daphnia pulex TaxID=6669 RepID=UPI001EDFC913|nr:mitochondrial uncoupling protein 4-like [Daphnia pulex]XP_046462019.1 mitochondrial uncoupling protein 4-like [Daphnia pulex]